MVVFSIRRRGFTVAVEQGLQQLKSARARQYLQGDHPAVGRIGLCRDDNSRRGPKRWFFQGSRAVPLFDEGRADCRNGRTPANAHGIQCKSVLRKRRQCSVECLAALGKYIGLSCAARGAQRCSHRPQAAFAHICRVGCLGQEFGSAVVDDLPKCQ